MLFIFVTLKSGITIHKHDKHYPTHGGTCEKTYISLLTGESEILNYILSLNAEKSQTSTSNDYQMRILTLAT